MNFNACCEAGLICVALRDWGDCGQVRDCDCQIWPRFSHRNSKSPGASPNINKAAKAREVLRLCEHPTCGETFGERTPIEGLARVGRHTSVIHPALWHSRANGFRNAKHGIPSTPIRVMPHPDVIGTSTNEKLVCLR